MNDANDISSLLRRMDSVERKLDVRIELMKMNTILHIADEAESVANELHNADETPTDDFKFLHKIYVPDTYKNSAISILIWNGEKLTEGEAICRVYNNENRKENYELISPVNGTIILSKLVAFRNAYNHGLPFAMENGALIGEIRQGTVEETNCRK